MLSLTKRTEYALIALTYMIEQGAISLDGKSPGLVAPASAREISNRYHVPLPLLMNILKKLSTAGVLISIRGAKGGYALATDPRKLTLSHLIKVLEGPVALVDCCCPPELVKQAMAKCKTSGTCPVRNPLQTLHQRLIGYLDSVVISDLCTKRSSERNGSKENIELRGKLADGFAVAGH